MSQSQISVPLTQSQAYALVDAVMECENLALSATARENTEGDWVFEALCAAEPDIDAFNDLARTILGGTLHFSLEQVDPDTNWVEKSLIDLKPVHAGGFYIYGSHAAGHAPLGATALLIEAAQAFGTGHHETTTGCLEAINLTLKRRKPRYLLDVGTGTGVLALAMAKRTHLAVIATDIDPVAIKTTLENARLNGLSKEIIAVEATGLNHSVIAENRPYDLIVANILAGPLQALAPEIALAAEPGATIILSGILNRQAARVISAYAAQGIRLSRRIEKGDWTTLILEKSTRLHATQNE